MTDYPGGFYLDDLLFVPARLVRMRTGVTNVFAGKNNKTLGETLEAPRYAGLAAETRRRYGDRLSEDLGKFLLSLKLAHDMFYENFLNPSGDETYCQFKLGENLQGKGLYCYTVSGAMSYIGRTHDPFAKRINVGYGNISPKNCYIDGQSTNCHLNALIARTDWSQLRFFVCVMESDEDIDVRERELIRSHNPPWNRQLR